MGYGSTVIDSEVADQRWLMGYVSGWMYAAVGVIGLVGPAFPGLRFHVAWQLCLGAVCIGYGFVNIVNLPHWERRPMWVHLGAMVSALPIIVLGLWASGGTHSYLRPILLLGPIHWGFFVRDRRVLAALCAGLILTFWTPTLYAAGAVTQANAATTATLSLTVMAVAAAMALIRSRLDGAEQQLRNLASRDPLTGLLNRRGFGAALDQLMRRRVDQSAFYLVLLDLDQLKQVNDTFGHPAGDEALLGFAQRLTAGARFGDVVGRVGGDEFAIAGWTREPRSVDRIASRLELAVAGELPGADDVEITATTGWAVCERPATDPADTVSLLVRDADEMLMATKRRRRGVDVARAAPAPYALVP